LGVRRFRVRHAIDGLAGNRAPPAGPSAAAGLLANAADSSAAPTGNAVRRLNMLSSILAPAPMRGASRPDRTQRRAGADDVRTAGR